MALLFQAVSAFLLLGVGFSQVLSPATWQRHYLRLAGMGETGACLNGLVSLAIGGLLVLSTTGSGLVATSLSLIGYLLLLEAAVAAFSPGTSLEALRLADQPWVERVVIVTGFVLSAAGAMMAAEVWLRLGPG